MNVSFAGMERDKSFGRLFSCMSFFDICQRFLALLRRRV